jgi:hypothetical protein
LDIAEAIEQHQSASYVELMGVSHIKVRVAVWEMRDGRCEHQAYSVGNTHGARIGEIGAPTWVEGWIA